MQSTMINIYSNCRMGRSPYSHWKIRSIYEYLRKGCLIQDLVDARVICLDHTGQLISRWNRSYEDLYEERPQIFSVVAGGQESAFIRFNVYSPDRLLTEVWYDREIHDAFVNYYSTILGNEEDTCYVTGRFLPTTQPCMRTR